MDLLYVLTKNYNEERSEVTLDFIEKLSKYIKETKVKKQIETDGEFKDLPYELIWQIALFIPNEDLINFMLTNKNYQTVFKNDNFWKEKFFVEFPSAVKFGYPKFIQKFLRKRKMSWKEIYELLGTMENFELFLKARFIFGEEEKTVSTWENKFILFYKKIKQLEKMMKNFISLDGFHNNLKDFISLENIDISIIREDMIFMFGLERLRAMLVSPFEGEDKSFILEFLKMFRKNRKNRIKKGYIFNKYRKRRDNYLIISLVLTINDTLRNDVDIMLEATKIYPYIIEHAGSKIRDNKKIMLYVLKTNGYFLQYASERLKQNEEIVFEAVKDDWQAFQYAHQYRKNDRAFVKKLIIEVNPEVFQFATFYLRNDKMYILNLINLNELSESDKYKILKYISNELKNDISFRIFN